MNANQSFHIETKPSRLLRIREQILSSKSNIAAKKTINAASLSSSLAKSAHTLFQRPLTTIPSTPDDSKTRSRSQPKKRSETKQEFSSSSLTRFNYLSPKSHSTFLNSDSDFFKQKQSSYDASFEKSLRYAINARDFKRISSLLKLIDYKNANSPNLTSQTQLEIERSLLELESRRQTTRRKLKKALNKVKIVLKMIQLYKIVEQKLNMLGLNKDIDEKRDALHDQLFNKEYFVRPREQFLPDELKKLLKIEPNERSDETLKYLITCLKLFVPEFDEYPTHMQKQLVRYAHYEEYEPGRMILRQGHYPVNFYLILCGQALGIEFDAANMSKKQPDELRVKITSNFKRGDYLGDSAIMNASRQPCTIRVHGSNNIIMLSIPKENFFRIQTEKKDSEIMEFMQNKIEILNSVRYPFHLLQTVNQFKQAYFSIYYRPGKVICESGAKTNDQFLYIVKNGTCKLMKRLRFDSKALEMYASSVETRRLNDFDKLAHSLHPVSGRVFQKPLRLPPEHHETLGRYTFSSEDPNFYSYVEIGELKEGDIFGLHDLVLNNSTDNKPTPVILVSNGAECILISKRYFMNFLDPKHLIKLSFEIAPYPHDDLLIKKYFHGFVWRDFKHETYAKTLKRMRHEKKFKSASMFSFR